MERLNKLKQTQKLQCKSQRFVVEAPRLFSIPAKTKEPVVFFR